MTEPKDIVALLIESAESLRRVGVRKLALVEGVVVELAAWSEPVAEVTETEAPSEGPLDGPMFGPGFPHLHGRGEI